MKTFNIEACIPYGNTASQWPQILAIIIAAFGSFMNGAIITWTSPSIPILISNSSHIDPITLEEASYFTVIPTISTVIASPILAILVDKMGRKKGIMLIAATYFLSWMTIGLAESLYIFYLARFVQGIGDAAVFTAIPMYIGEISEPKVRGTWGNTVILSIFFGFFVMNFIGTYCDIKTTALIFGSITILGFFIMGLIPESPYYLIMKNREEEARKSLKKLRWMENVEDELLTLGKNVRRKVAQSGSIKDLFFDPTNRKTLIIALGIRASQPFSGLPAFTMYTQYMFSQAGSKLSNATSAMIFSGAFTIAVAGASSVVEKLGRKPLMIFSCLGCGICLAIEAAYFFIHEKTNLDTFNISWVPLAGMLLYIPVSAAGLAIIPTLMLGELFPTNVKGNALCVLNICFSIFVLLVTKLFQVLSSRFGMYLPFGLFAACCFLNVIFSYYFIPETKGKTLEEIQQYLKGHKVNKPDTFGGSEIKY